MNWKDIFSEATSIERAQILHLLKQRIQTQGEQSRMKRRSFLGWFKGVVANFIRWLFHPRRRAHWLGRRRRRPERLFTVLLFLVAMIVLEPREYAVWATIAGGFTVLLLPLLFLHHQLMCLLGEVD